MTTIQAVFQRFDLDLLLSIQGSSAAGGDLGAVQAAEVGSGGLQVEWTG